jgi:hypothetical protein
LVESKIHKKMRRSDHSILNYASILLFPEVLKIDKKVWDGSPEPGNEVALLLQGDSTEARPLSG